MDLLGMKIVPQSLAREVRTEFRVVRWPLRKKRSSWMVRRIEINRPGCWQVGDTLYMHPDLISKLPHSKTPKEQAEHVSSCGCRACDRKHNQGILPIGRPISPK